MKEAIKQAKKAAVIGDVPIGCVIVEDDKIIARAYNQRNKKKTTLAHAELLAIQKASKKVNDWRLEDCTMYITLEPCQMCAGAIVQARIPKVVIGAMNPKAGCAGSVLNILQIDKFNHQVEIERGILEEECSQMLSDFFKELRQIKDNSREEKFADDLVFLNSLKINNINKNILIDSIKKISDIKNNNKTQQEVEMSVTFHFEQIKNEKISFRKCDFSFLDI